MIYREVPLRKCFGKLNPLTTFICTTWYVQFFYQCCFFVNLPLTVFMKMDVFCPFTPISCGKEHSCSFSNMNVPWLQLSSNACVFTVFPEWLYLRITGTTHMLITFPPVLTLAHFASTPFGVSAQSFFWVSFCFFFLTYPWSVAERLTLHTLHILRFAQVWKLQWIYIKEFNSNLWSCLFSNKCTK